MDAPLLDRTLELLARKDLPPLKEIALGAEVEYSWLKQIRRWHLQGKSVGNPGVIQIEKVYKYLSAWLLTQPSAGPSQNGASA